MTPRALVTGGAGFIGSHLVDALLDDGWAVTVIDDFNDSYSPAVKRGNIARHLDYRSYRLIEADIRSVGQWVPRAGGEYDVVVHLAARAGVRQSIAQPELYEDVNVRGTQSVLAYALSRHVPRFVFASSSSVYGVNPRTPWHEDDADLRPISPYATTKLAAECLGRATTYASDTQFVSLRFFTVYGPRQRPDLAIHTFTRNILDGRPITVFGDGTTMRDYTYVDDIVAGVRSAMAGGAATSETLNLGNDRPVSLMELIGTLQALLGRRAKLEYRPLPAGDVPSTWAAIDRARAELGYEPSTSLATGLARFVEWLVARDAKAA